MFGFYIENFHKRNEEGVGTSEQAFITATLPLPDTQPREARWMEEVLISFLFRCVSALASFFFFTILFAIGVLFCFCFIVWAHLAWLSFWEDVKFSF